ncbi:SDR family NAD(P)-dependent oxidoreductase [Bremerella cremea]|uniref:Glucose dehydrogenase n=1 Tax=Blastopirellula marina TaxID=124 RepID=A0A2S8FBJ3_9BACT|nr:MULTISPECIES: SDR family NAD(P)-dependent oxidoreductase [Pirellulaceae]PQO29533.1 glucose dehydrogenase [Blastopirellula marina]RCS42837.1 SDR family NAD(P)-dependent oxidoreductase [Bremerella cremea]
MRRQLDGLRMLVTGASSGIGRAMAILAAEQGAKLLLTARREDRLEELLEVVHAKGCDATYVVGDITDPALHQRLFERVQHDLKGLDVLVNNAGIGAHGNFDEASPERLRQLMEVNFFAPVELTRKFLPLLEQGRTPAICNISSILGHRAVPGKSEYCASKFALHGFSDALRAELATKGIDVILVSPSTTSSEFGAAVIEQRGKPPAKGKFARTPHDVAKAALKAIKSGRHEIIPSKSGYLMVWIDRMCPSFADWMVAKFG